MLISFRKLSINVFPKVVNLCKVDPILSGSLAAGLTAMHLLMQISHRYRLLCLGKNLHMTFFQAYLQPLFIPKKQICFKFEDLGF